MEINNQAPITAQREIVIQAPPEAVWKIHTAINEWSQWQPAIDMTKLDGPLAPGSIFQWKSGGLTITSTIQIVEPNQQIGWTGWALGTRASHIWLLESHDGGTMLTTKESMEGWLVRILKLAAPRFLEKSLDTWLRSLKDKVEDGNIEG